MHSLLQSDNHVCGNPYRYWSAHGERTQAGLPSVSGGNIFYRPAGLYKFDFYCSPVDKLNQKSVALVELSSLERLLTGIQAQGLYSGFPLQDKENQGFQSRAAPAVLNLLIVCDIVNITFSGTSNFDHLASLVFTSSAGIPAEAAFHNESGVIL